MNDLVLTCTTVFEMSKSGRCEILLLIIRCIFVDEIFLFLWNKIVWLDSKSLACLY